MAAGGTPSYSSAASSAAAALFAIATAGADAARKIATAEGAVEALVSALGKGGEMSSHTCAALANIAAVDEEHARRVAAEPGAVPALLFALAGRYGEGAAGSAADCLMEISRLDGPYRTCIYDAPNAVPALAAALSRGGERPAIAAAGLLADAARASQAHAAALVEAPGGTLPALVSGATCRSAGGAAAVVSSSLALARVAYVAAEMPLPFAQQRYAIAALVAALRAPPDEAVPPESAILMQSHLAGGLFALAEASDDCARAIGSAAGAALALSRVLNCGADTPVAVAAAAIGRVATVSHGFAKLAAEEPGLLPGLVSLASAQPADRATAGLCSLTLVATASRELAARVAAEPGALSAALAALHRPGEDDDVITAGKQLLTTAATNAPAAACELARLLAPPDGPYAATAHAVLGSRLLGLTPAAVDALDAAVYDAWVLQTRLAALEELAAAAAAEAAARPRACAACRRPPADDLKLHPCAGCSGGPAGVLYCSPACQRADWGRHRPYCRCAAAVKAAAAADAAEAAAAAEAGASGGAASPAAAAGAAASPATAAAGAAASPAAAAEAPGPAAASD
ncbi:hypothetical protein Rsub_09043 [Raphidocelis subcapitata]|uniref:MYND-type domain-containing protein n=1 Tax=Raphidocelis subcapitata TaxID=307507 RepID=A0A2V0PGD4_9CHLO|nr:hypothetical protein Rsub_09043 [Raphidocelis subcapitata]|eukprot:GBF96963.1 hypothetical protein Rsub_09043 [Raphidocelis subcapitata]